VGWPTCADPYVPQAQDETCFGDCELAGGKGILIAVAKALYTSEARSTVINIIIEQADGSEHLGCV